MSFKWLNKFSIVAKRIIKFNCKLGIKYCKTISLTLFFAQMSLFLSVEQQSQLISNLPCILDKHISINEFFLSMNILRSGKTLVSFLNRVELSSLPVYMVYISYLVLPGLAVLARGVKAYVNIGSRQRVSFLIIGKSVSGFTKAKFCSMSINFLYYLTFIVYS